MAVRLRLSRVPFSRNNPRYTVVATNASKRATAKPLEVLGTFSPVPKVEAPVAFSPNGHQRDIKTWGPRQFGTSFNTLPGQQQQQQRRTGGSAAIKATSPERTLLETVGASQIEWNVERVKHWLKLGAIPSKPVERLLNRAGLLQTSLFTRPEDRPVSRETRINRAVRALRAADA
ncbi:37S ribosomal protein S16, mitochondrial [Microbotryomycetes sp. JL221]|nr:37S ribosomal protein S16, mitochondrial [Microbotryomycetes sp. JL221]